MSADNFLYICHPPNHPDKFIMMDLSASVDMEDPNYRVRAASDYKGPLFDTYEQALAEAQKVCQEEIVEYGVEVQSEVVEERKAAQQRGALRVQRMRETLDWIISLDDPANQEERRSVTLNEVIVRARTAVKEPS